MAYTVKAVADMAGISVRALHHYDEIGLLRPASISGSGYRQYATEDLERLQQVLFFRELGFSLQDIRGILNSPDFNRREALVSHRALLLEKQKRLETLIRSVDETIEAMERGEKMSEEKMFEGFDRKQIEEWREEARQKWGSEQVDESYRRTSKYTKEDWDEIKREGQEVSEGLAALMDRDPGDPEVQTLIHRHFKQINERFYSVTPEIYRGLGELYVSDPRFTANYDNVRPGPARFMKAAMEVYADGLER